ncbi:MAG: cupin domain-containing protein [Ruminococcaceae bacterium]|nr:cupin domain-containing protein [Oscillospiraceae bacterium]
MSERVREIAGRLREMREIAGLSVEEVGQKLTITTEKYRTMESGDVDIPVSVLCEAAEIFGISVTELLTGDRAKLKMYSVVRKNKGIGVERTAGYDYKSLAYSFADRKVEPLLVTLDPGKDIADIHPNAHAGHEFHYCIEGKMNFYIGGHTVEINEGDSLYFDSEYPHAMVAVGDEPVKLVVVVIK